jgi:hypothetical protein
VSQLEREKSPFKIFKAGIVWSLMKHKLLLVLACTALTGCAQIEQQIKQGQEAAQADAARQARCSGRQGSAGHIRSCSYRKPYI